MMSIKYWEECVEEEEMEAMWVNNEVRREWNDAGEFKGHMVHLSRDPEGHPFLTQTEIMAVASIVVSSHFSSQIDPEMICAIAELESDRQPLRVKYDRKTKEETIGIMQLLPKTADWISKEMGGSAMDESLLYRPFVNVYLGAAYLRWLSNYEQSSRSEEFVVRAFKGGIKKVAHKSTLLYWRRYLSVKESLPSRRDLDDTPFLGNNPPEFHYIGGREELPFSEKPGDAGASADDYTLWDTKVSAEDMEDMWSHPGVCKEWRKTGDKRGNVRFCNDKKGRPYLSRVELKAVAEIILWKHFSTREAKSSVLCALAEVVSMRFLNGVGSHVGVMGIDHPTAMWLHNDMGYKAYGVETTDDLSRPFVSMYFGAAYMAWLSEYEGRERTPQFIVQAYISGPKSVNLQETCPLWLRFKEELRSYDDAKRDQGSCSIL